jgi:hypothetical protein
MKKNLILYYNHSQRKFENIEAKYSRKNYLFF